MTATTASRRQPGKKLSNLQMELLKLYALDVSDDDLLAIRQMLSTYFMQKAMDEADRVWDERNYNADLMKTWLKADRNDLKNEGRS